jgi:acetyltransferase
MAFVAIDETSSEMLAVVWIYSESVRETGKHAILLTSDLNGRGSGWVC